MSQLSRHLRKEGDTMGSISLTNGYWFYFQDEGLDIVAHGSAWNGKEVVYVNEDPVSEKRVLTKFKSEHDFRHSGKDYRVEFEMVSIMRGELECRLYVDGELHSSHSKAFVDRQMNGWQFLLKLAGLFVAGFIFGYLSVTVFSGFFGA